MAPTYAIHGLFSVTPEITRRKLEEGDKFLIMATDGLWDFIDPETAVDVIAHHLESLQQSTQSTHDDHCIHSQEVISSLILENVIIDHSYL